MRTRDLNKFALSAAQHYPEWKAIKTVVYRRAGAVLQGVHLEGSSFSEVFVPVWFFQALSQPFPTFNLTLGERFKDGRACDLWLDATAGDVLTQLIDEMARQVLPSPHRPLSEADVLGQLLRMPQDNPTWQWAVGSLLATTDRIDDGRRHLGIAAQMLAATASEWALEWERLLQQWLELSDEALGAKLRSVSDSTAGTLKVR